MHAAFLLWTAYDARWTGVHYAVRLESGEYFLLVDFLIVVNLTFACLAWEYQFILMFLGTEGWVMLTNAHAILINATIYNSKV